MKKKILIIPAAAYKEVNETIIPDIFTINNSGKINIIYNMMGMPLDDFDSIYITINKRIDELYNVKKMLEAQLELLNILYKTHIIIIDKTRNVIDTILETMPHINESNYGMFIKDADVGFTINELNNENTVYTYLLEDVSLINPSSKSYVATTSDDIILNIIEKRVISSEFCAGGYYFADNTLFTKLAQCVNEYSRLYLSNVIYYDILRNNEVYRTEQVIDFNE